MQPFIAAAAQQYESGAEWIRASREAGTSYRTQDMYADWRREHGLALHEAQIKAMSPDKTPPQSFWTETPWDGLSTSLLYEFRVELRDIETGEVVSAFRATGTNKLLTFEEAAENYRQRVEEGLSDPRFEVVSVTPMDVRHKVGARVEM
jgi:hypothetical protein